jgi:hypothetical protein
MLDIADALPMSWVGYRAALDIATMGIFEGLDIHHIIIK